MKIAIMSFAHMHAYSYAQVLKRLAGVDLIGISDEKQARGKEAAEKFGVTYYNNHDDLLKIDQLDAVIICSENINHKELTIKSARAKKHILCEKPLATSVADGWEMIHVCKEEGVKLMTAFPVRYSTPILQLKSLVDKGGVGEIISMRTTNRGQNPGNWFVKKDLSGGGAVLDHTVHMIDIMRWILGAEVKDVFAEVDTLFTNLPIDDAGILSLSFVNGVIASHDPSWSRNSSYPTWGDATIEIVGTKGRAYADAFGEHLEFYSLSGKPYRHTLFGKDMDTSLLKDFIACIKEDRTPSVSGLDGLRAMEVALAAYKSGEINRPVELGKEVDFA